MKNVSYKVVQGDFDSNNQPTSNPVTVTEVMNTPYTVIQVPTMVPHFVDYVKGYINCVEGDEEVQYSFSDINYEDMCQHACMLDFLNSHPCKFDNQRHIYPMYNGNSGFGGMLSSNQYPKLSKHFHNTNRFQNKIKFKLEPESIDTTAGTTDYIATMYVPLSSILESTSRASLINLKLLDLDFYLYDLAKYIDKVDLYINVEKDADGNLLPSNEGYWRGVNQVTEPSQRNSCAVKNKSLISHFYFQDLEIYDCDLYIAQFEFSDMSEYHNMPNTDKGLVVAQVDNHVLDINPQCDINKFTVRVPFKPATCYIYFTHDTDSNCSNRTDYLYLNAPKYLNVKTLTGWSSTYPYYENDGMVPDGLTEAEYKSPDPRLFEELHYVLNKYDTPLINYDSFALIHRIYAVDMNSHLNLSDNTNELIFEIQFEDEIDEDDNIRMHVIFERDYSK